MIRKKKVEGEREKKKDKTRITPPPCLSRCFVDAYKYMYFDISNECNV